MLTLRFMICLHFNSSCTQQRLRRAFICSTFFFLSFNVIIITYKRRKYTAEIGAWFIWANVFSYIVYLFDSILFYWNLQEIIDRAYLYRSNQWNLSASISSKRVSSPHIAVLIEYLRRAVVVFSFSFYTDLFILRSSY